MLKTILINLVLRSNSLLKMFPDLWLYVADFRRNRFSCSPFVKKLGLNKLEESWHGKLQGEDSLRVMKAWNTLLNGEVDHLDIYYCLNDASGKTLYLRDISKKIVRGRKNQLLIIGMIHDYSKVWEAKEEASIRTREKIALNSIFEVISSSLRLDETVDGVLIQIKNIIPYGRATIQFIDSMELKVVGFKGFTKPDTVKNVSFNYSDESSPFYEVVWSRKPVIINNLNNEQACKVDFSQKPHSKSWLGLPLFVRGDLIGIISLSNQTKDFYTEEHRKLARLLIGPISIVLENSKMHGESYRLAMEDALTGIGSRHAFDLNGRYIYENSQRKKQQLSIAMLDLDNFKEVNDGFGHVVGDIVLTKVAHTCQEGLRTTDLIARYGGEEIVILFPETQLNDAVRIMKRVRENVAGLTFDGMDRSITISVGCTGCIPARNLSLSEMIKLADTALYNAKRAGKNQTAVA